MTASGSGDVAGGREDEPGDGQGGDGEAAPARLLATTARILGPVGGAVLLALALAFLHRELHVLGYHGLRRALAAVTAAQAALAVVLACLSYAALAGYDQLAFLHLGRDVPRARVAVAAFVGQAMSNSFGFAWLAGSFARYRFYARFGLSPAELTQVIVFNSVTLWLGFAALAGSSLLLAPPEALPWGQHAGALLLLLALVYLALALVARGPLRAGRFTLALPRPAIALAQLAVSVLDWTLAAAAFDALLPPGGPGFAHVLAAFLTAQIAGHVSHVPGGLGVFESAIVLLLGASVPAGPLLGALVLFRAVYYLVPLVLALGVVLADEVRLRRVAVWRAAAVFGDLSAQIAPRALAVLTFLAGAVLLFSGATPAEASRLHFLARLYPLAVFEASSLLGSVAGVGLLVVSDGIARRLDVAWYIASLLLAVGVGMSLLKGGDFEEATVLLLLLLVLWRAHGRFDRKAAFFATRFSPGWTTAVIGAVGASVWLGHFAFRHVEYSHELLWRFELDAEVPRFLRASFGATVAVLAFGIARLVRPAPPEVVLPGADELAAADRIVAGQETTLPYLVHLRDKALLFNDARTAFVAYAVRGRTWVALGDPVGPIDAAPELIRRFIERADDFHGTPVFYQVAKDRLHQYADLGLAFFKLGEEARVRLDVFSIKGDAAKHFRAAVNRVAREGGTFRILAPDQVPAALDSLHAVSDAWLAGKTASEKGFSLGRFDPAYVRRFPVAVLERHGRIDAFAVVWPGPGPGRDELSVDLMRFADDRARFLMDALFVHLLLWGKEQGYRWFNLGMAPLSGLEPSPFGLPWARLAHWVYRHGEAFYNFQGLRAYKEKFHPAWEPRYLAYPGGLSLPRIVAETTALVAGGYTRILR